jgi:hypothetical protein
MRQNDSRSQPSRVKAVGIAFNIYFCLQIVVGNGSGRPGVMMRINRKTVLIAIGLLLLRNGCAFGQTSSAANELWPAFRANFDVRPRLGAQVTVEKHDGEDAALAQWKVGAIVNYRMSRIFKRLLEDIDGDNQYNLVLGGGYEYIKTTQTSGTKREHRIVIQTTPKHAPGVGVLLQDRSRAEFRWVDGVYNFRYRNKLTVHRAFKISKVRFTPYASGELFWDRNHHAWNENQYAFGVQLPYKKLLMLDTYYLRQNCTTCSQDPVSVVGLTLNFYFKLK